MSTNHFRARLQGYAGVHERDVRHPVLIAVPDAVRRHDRRGVHLRQPERRHPELVRCPQWSAQNAMRFLLPVFADAWRSGVLLQGWPCRRYSLALQPSLFCAASALLEKATASTMDTVLLGIRSHTTL